MRIEDGALGQRKPKKTAREGWAEASQALAATGDDALVLGAFPGTGDTELVWLCAESFAGGVFRVG